MTGSGTTAGGAYTDDTAAQPWSLTAPDGSSLQFQVRQGDVPADLAANGSSVEESIANFATQISAETPTDISFNFTLAPGAVNTAPYLVLAQLNQSGTTSNPPFDIDLAGDQMVIYVRYTDANGNIVARQVYADPTKIIRGHSYSFDIKATFDSSGNGRLQIVRDGVTLVDYSGPLGFAGDQNLTWQEGIRRGVGSTQTISATYSNLSITSGTSVQFANPTTFLSGTTVPAYSNVVDVANLGGTYAATLGGFAAGYSTVSLYVDGVYAGFANANATGQWTSTVDFQSLGAHAIYVVATNAAGVSSSTSYAATVKIGGIGDPAQVQPGYYYLDMNGISYSVQTASKPWSISEPDANTLRFEVRSHDVAYYDYVNFRTANRSEVAINNIITDGTPIELSYGFNVEPGVPNTSYFMVLGQLHQDVNATGAPWGPPFDIGLQGEVMTIDIKYTGADGNPVSQRVFTDVGNIQRGHYYAIDVKVLFDPNGNGRLVVTRDGVTIVDYSGPLGYTSENGVYWKEGVYRNSNALEAFAADYRGLTITTGSAVKFPDPSAFIAAPVVGVSAVSSAASDGSRLFTLQGTAKAGTTVSILQNGVVVGSGPVGSNGSFTTQLTLQGTGEILLDAVATDATGRNGLTSAPIAIEIGTAANAVSKMDAYQALPNLAAIVLTDTNVLTVTSTTQLATLTGHDRAALSKIQGSFTFALTQAFTGKSYDTQTQIYTSAGVLKEVIRYLASAVVFDQVIASDGSQVVRSVQTNGTYSIASLAANGSTIEIDQYTSANLLYSKDQRFTDGSRLVTTWNQTTGAQTGYTQYNADKSYKAVTLGITGQTYTSQAQSYNTAGKLLLQERFTAAGIRIFSSATSPTGVQTTQIFSASTGVMTSYTTVNPDGSTIQAQFGITGQTYSGQVLTYDKSKSLLEKDLLDANGVLLSMTTSSPGQWSRVFTVSSGVTTGYTQTNTSDGSKAVAVFAAGGAPGQLASVNTYTSAGKLIETDLYNATGQKISANVFSGGVGVLTTFDPTTGFATGQTQTNADTSQVVTIYAPGAARVPASISTFNTSGVLVETDLFNAAGSKVSATVFGSAGSRVLTNFDATSGNATGYTRFNSDGSSSVAVYAAGSPGQLASVNLYSAVGALVETDTYSGGQQTSATQFTTGSSVTVYAASGIATGATMTNADGSTVVVTYASGLPGQFSTVNAYNSAGTLTESDLYTSSGVKASSTVPSGSGTLLTTFDPKSGLATGTTQTNGDGSKVVSTFGAGVPGQLAQVQSFSPSGTLVETDLYSAGAKSSTDVFTAGAGDLLTTFNSSSGVAIGTTQTNADGSRIVSTYAAGAPGVLTSVSTFSASSALTEADLYNAGGQKISTDVFIAGGDLFTTIDPNSGNRTATTQTNGNGSKVLTTYANGIVASVNSYSAANTLVETDLYNSVGTRISADVFSGSGDVLTSYDPNSGLATGYTQTTISGSKSVGVYASGAPGQLASVQMFDASGNLLETDLYSATGAKATADVFVTGGGDILTSYDPASGFATGYTQTNADGSKSIGVYAAGLPGQLVSVTSYTASGALAETDLYNAKGQKVTSDVILAGGGDLLTAFDPGTTVVTTTTQTNPDGSSIVSQYGISLSKAILQQNFYSSAQVLTETDLYNFTGQKISSTVFGANNASVVTTFDVVSGLATSATQFNADGTRTLSQFAAGIPGQVQTLFKYNASGVRTETDIYNSTAQLLSTTLYNSDGSSLVTAFNPQTGLPTGTTLTNANGSQCVSVYASGTATGLLASVSFYDTSSNLIETDLYNAAGSRISAVVYAANGSSLLTTYDPLTALATGTTQVNVDGSKTVTGFASGLPGQLASVSSYNATGALTERDLYGASGQRVSTDVFTVGNGDLLTTYDPITGLTTGYIQTNADASRMAVTYAPGLPGQVATTTSYNSSGTPIETDQYLAGQTIVSRDVFTAGAGDLLTTYDPVSGLATGTTQTFVDGSKAVSVFAVGVPGQLVSVNTFTPAGLLSETDLYNGLGQKISTDVFTSGAGDLLTAFDPVSGLATGTTRTSTDGSKVVSVFAPGTPGQLASVISYNAAGNWTERDLYNTSGQRISAETIVAGNGDRLTKYDPTSGFALGFSQTNPDGSTVIGSYALGQLTTTNGYNAAGVLIETDQYAAGQKVSSDVFTPGIAGDLLTTFDPVSGIATGTVKTNADKSRVVTTYMLGSTQIASLNSYNTAGQLVAAQTWGSDGSRKVYAFKSVGVENGYTTTALDGSKTIATFVPGNEAILIQVRFYDQTGWLKEGDNYNAVGVKILAQTANRDGSHAVYNFDPITGAATSYILYGADKSRTEVNLVITGKPYTQQSATYNPAGTLVSMQRWFGDANHTMAFSQSTHADGSLEVHNYDTLARETSRQLTAADGSKDVYAFTYGTGTAPLTIQQDHYNSSQTKVWTDITNSDGSHKTTALTSGASITASVGSVDVLTAATTGANTFVFKPAFGQDIITNFHAGTTTAHDTVDLTALGLLSPGQAASDYLAHALTQVVRDTVLTVNSTEAITFKNTQLASLVSNQFKF